MNAIQRHQLQSYAASGALIATDACLLPDWWSSPVPLLDTRPLAAQRRADRGIARIVYRRFRRAARFRRGWRMVMEAEATCDGTGRVVLLRAQEYDRAGRVWRAYTWSYRYSGGRLVGRDIENRTLSAPPEASPR